MVYGLWFRVEVVGFKETLEDDLKHFGDEFGRRKYHQHPLVTLRSLKVLKGHS